MYQMDDKEVNVKVWMIAVLSSMVLVACSSSNEEVDASGNNGDSVFMTWDQDTWNSKSWE